MINLPLEFITLSQSSSNELSSWLDIDFIESDSIFKVLFADAI